MTIFDVRKAKTSELLAFMNPDVVTEVIAEAGGGKDQMIALMVACAAEIDRRIPVPE